MRRPFVLALGLRLVGYVLLAVGVATHPLDGALVVAGAAAVLEGLIVEAEAS